MRARMDLFAVVALVSVLSPAPGRADQPALPTIKELVAGLADDKKCKTAAAQLKKRGSAARKPLQNVLRATRAKDAKLERRIRDVLATVGRIEFKVVATAASVSLEGKSNQELWTGPARRLLVLRDKKTLAGYKAIKDALAGTKIDFKKQMVIVVAGRFRGTGKIDSALFYDAGDELTMSYHLDLVPFSGRGDRPAFWKVFVTGRNKLPVRFIERSKTTWPLVPNPPGPEPKPIDRGRLAPNQPELSIKRR